MSQKSITPNKLKEAKFPERATEKEVKELKAHKVAKGEELLYHVALLPRSFDGTTGDRTAPVTVQKYNQQSFRLISEQNKFQGYEVVILHDPTEEAAPSSK